MAATSLTSSSATYLVRIVFLRAMAFVHAVAFVVALRQNKALLGDRGISPARYVLDDAHERGQRKIEKRLWWRRQGLDKPENSKASRTPWQWRWFWIRRKLGSAMDHNARLRKFREVWWDRTDGMDRPVTSILWLSSNRERLDPWLDGIAWTGLSVACTILCMGAANVPLILTLWVCQRSLMAVGGAFYGFGWEPQLAELSFHTLFLVPLFSLDPLPNFPIPPAVRWTLQWYLFRIMMGAGLIKLRSGDSKWKDLTAMNYFYETQPVPNPLTRYFHWMPPAWHQFEVLANHFVELIAPWLLIVPFLPINWRRVGGLIQILFQAVLITSGNFSFLNWLTMVPAIVCLDDALVSRLFPVHMSFAAQAASWSNAMSPPSYIRNAVSLSFLALIGCLSVPVVNNLLSKSQIMNGSFDRLRLVNTYGAFGTVNIDRDEFIISAATTIEGPWKEYNFPAKPGNPRSIPKWISPYHHRLDWQMWIAATCRVLDRSPWMFRFLIRLLERDPGVLALMGDDPWANALDAPKYIRIDRYRYKFHKQNATAEDNPPLYWDRELIARVYPPRGQGVATMESLRAEVQRRTPRQSV